MDRMHQRWLAGMLIAGLFVLMLAGVHGRVTAQEGGPQGHAADAAGQETVTCSISQGSAYTTVFLPYTLYNCGWEGHGIGTGDFNHDGRTDVALSIGALLIFLQNGDGTLAQPVSYAGGTGSLFLTTGDFNNDGWDDVATAGGGTNVITVYLQQEGGLAERVSYITNSQPDSIAVGDVNNDALDDILISHGNSETIGVFIQNLNGTLDPMITYPSIDSGWDDIAAGDVNGDGRTDLIKMNGENYANPHILVYLQNTGGTLDAATAYRISNCPNCFARGLAVGDVTGDGREDVALTYFDSGGSHLAVFRQEMTGILHASLNYPAYGSSRAVSLGDINSDSRLDVVLLHKGFPQAGVYTQKENGTLGQEALYPLANDSNFGNQDQDVGDVNGDGYPDLLIADNKGMVILYHREPTPEPLLPSGRISDATPTYTWGSISGATQYRYEVMKGAAVLYTKLVAPSACTSGTCSSTPAVLLADTSYQWRVQTMVGGAWMPYSNYKAFVVDAVPTLSGPPARISDTTPTFEWRRIAGASQYRFQLMKGTTLLYTKLVDASACNISTGICSSTPAVKLADGAYKWRAQLMSGGQWMPYSAYREFRLQTVPTPLDPSGTISDIMPTYRWTSIVNATLYRFQVYRGTALVFTQTFFDSSCDFAACRFKPYMPLTYGSYSWRVQAMLGGVWKPYSLFKPFSISQYTKPRAGFWKGLKDEFYVTPDQGYVDDFSTYVYVPGCGSYKITHTAPEPIANNYFGFNGAFHANGTFNSPSTVSGSEGLISYYIPGCGSVSGGPWSYTAAWNSAAQPLIATVEPDAGIDVAGWIEQALHRYRVVKLEAPAQ